mgnify:CR=1 FL=1
MIPCREIRKEPVHIERNTPLKVIESLAETPCKSHNCSKCCEFGTGTALESDIPNIAKQLGMSEKDTKAKFFEPITKFNTTHWRPQMLAKPYGPCVFLDKQKGCTIHSVRPTGCKLSSWNQHSEQLNEWFDTNYFVNANDNESIRQWATRLQFNSATIPGAKLNELVPDKEKLRKILAHEL